MTIGIAATRMITMTSFHQSPISVNPTMTTLTSMMTTIID
uniref:Uncharacterized protein n=1 Tax=Spodoptera exigua multiple nucleopolyhedrovirus TaxID=10454 RepID=A0A6N0C2M7_9ABAC|nr:hypothetical protein [Spodoptera exigua multiple nucleopolyhedrovirus]